MNNLLFTFVAFLLLIQSALAGIDPSNNFKLGNGAASDKKITFFRGASNPIIKWDEATQKLRFCNDGVTCNDFGASSGGSSGVEALEQKCELEHFGNFTDLLDKSLGTGFKVPPPAYSIPGTLLEAYTSGSSTIALVWGARPLVSSDKNLDSTTNWTVQGAGATLTTSATAKFGTASLKFDKDGSNSSARIRYNSGAKNLGLSGFTGVWLQVNLPSLTNLTNVEVRVDQDSTNYQAYTTSTNWAGSAITTGWNLLHIDLSTGGVASGTGWNSGLAFQYFHVGVNTSTTGQTYTGILVDSIVFEIDNPSRYAALGSQFTLYDSTNRDNITIDSSNTRVDGGTVTLASSVAHNYAAGFGATKGSVYRSTLSIADGRADIASVNPAGVTLGGSVLKNQEVRLSRTLTTGLDNSKLDLFADVNTPQVYPVVSTTVSTVVVTDTVDQSGDLLSGETVHIFRTIYSDGTAHFVHRCDMTLTGNSTNTGGQTTINGTPCGGTVAGDYVVKNHIATSYSATTIGANESFTTVSPKTSPEGVLLYDTGIPYPHPESVWGHWLMGGTSTTEAFRNLKGVAPAFAMTGTLNIFDSFLHGNFSLSGFTDPIANYLEIAVGSASQQISGDSVDNTLVQISFWLFDTTGHTGAARYIITNENGGSQGWILGVNGTADTVQIGYDNAAPIAQSAYTAGVWNHVFLRFSDSPGTTTIYINGSQVASVSTPDIQTASNKTNFRIGAREANTSGGPGLKIADLTIWKDGSALSDSEIALLPNSGLGRVLGFGPRVKYRYSTSGVTGQALTMKTSLSVDTTAVKPFVGKMGLLGQ